MAPRGANISPGLLYDTDRPVYSRLMTNATLPDRVKVRSRAKG